MGSDQRKIEAPAADVAALYYFAHCVNANVPMVAVYTENGKPYEGSRWWLDACFGAVVPDLEARIKACADQAHLCRVVPDGETEVTTDDLVDQWGA